MKIKLNYYKETDKLNFSNMDFDRQGLLVGDDEDNKYAEGVWIIRFFDDVTKETEGYQILDFWEDKDKLKGIELPCFDFPKILDEAIDMVSKNEEKRELEI